MPKIILHPFNWTNRYGLCVSASVPACSSKADKIAFSKSSMNLLIDGTCIIRMYFYCKDHGPSNSNLFATFYLKDIQPIDILSL